MLVGYKLMVLEMGITLPSNVEGVDIVCSVQRCTAGLIIRVGRLRTLLNIRNLTNLPSGSVHGKLIKSCFQSNDRWLFVGADYNALEARVDALWTKDKNKLAVYQGGYDSHSFNTYAYWKHEFDDIREAVEALPEDAHTERAKHINRIKKEHDKKRSKSKAVTFALQFKGTYRTLMTNSGFSEKEAKMIVANYDTVYADSKKATDDRIAQANIDGYITAAFGLRVRTPLIKKAILGSNLPKEVEAEIRTAGNAMSQSYGMLTNKVLIDTIEDSERDGLAEVILPCCQIHDAEYMLVERNLSTLKKLNDYISKNMSKVDLPEIQHPDVGLEGELDLFYPTWADAITLKNYMSEEEILALIDKKLS
jgi:DNA polymerase-1